LTKLHSDSKIHRLKILCGTGKIPVLREAKKCKIKILTMTCRIDSPIKVDYYRNGGILHTVLRNFLADS